MIGRSRGDSHSLPPLPLPLLPSPLPLPRPSSLPLPLLLNYRLCRLRTSPPSNDGFAGWSSRLRWPPRLRIPPAPPRPRRPITTSLAHMASHRRSRSSSPTQLAEDEELARKLKTRDQLARRHERMDKKAMAFANRPKGKPLATLFREKRVLAHGSHGPSGPAIRNDCDR